MPQENDPSAEDLAAMFIDAAPEDTESTAEYMWAKKNLSYQDLLDTGLGVDFLTHAKNIGLDPSKSDLTRPVVVTIGDNERHPIAVWDGVHRIMSALALKVEGIPAVVGLRKDALIFSPPKAQSFQKET